MEQIFCKNPLTINKIGENLYSSEAILNYGKIDIFKLFEFEKMHILKDVNSDIVQHMRVYDIKDETATIFLEYKHFLKEFGFPKFGAHVDIRRNKNDNIIDFFAKNNTSKYNNSDCTIFPIDDIHFRVQVFDFNKISININVKFNTNFQIPPFAEKFALRIVHKMFVRLKEFIEIV
jgi:hypothetical protein